MRNKVPKVFWVNKINKSKRKEESFNEEDESEEDDSSSFKGFKEIYKIERFAGLRRRQIVRPAINPKVHNRITNDYPHQVSFKIEKIQRQLIKPFSLKRYPNKKKLCDVISTSTKRSSRESSRNKAKSFWFNPCPPIEIAPLNLLKFEQKDTYLENNRIDYHLEPVQADKNLNEMEFLKDDIQAFKFEEQLEEDAEVGGVIINHINHQLQLESLPSYHDFELDQDCKQVAQKLINTYKLEQAPRQYRQRTLSGWIDCEVPEAPENNCFLFGNERETLIYEPFIANKQFSTAFGSQNLL